MRPGRRCAQLAMAGLVCMGPMAQAQVPAPQSLVVKDGQSATEIALDEVAPGTTIDQFLLALYQLNPQAFIAGDLNRLLAQARLVLPTAEQANRVPLAQAREELARIKGGAIQPASQPPESATPPSLSAPEPVSAASMPPALESAPAPAAPLPSPAAAPQSTLTWLWWLMAPAALLALALMRRKRPTAAAANSPPPDAEPQAQGRFQPVLPSEPPAPPSAPAPVAGAPKPALFDLDLHLGGAAPPLDLPKGGGLGKLPDLSLNLDLPSPTPRASTPGPLDLSGLSLDLGTDPPARKDAA